MIGLRRLNSRIQHKFVMMIKKNEEDSICCCALVFVRRLTRKRNTPCSICRLAIGSRRLIMVLNSSNSPYSVVVRMLVYIGSSRNCVIFVQKVPKNRINVLLANSLLLFDMSIYYLLLLGELAFPSCDVLFINTNIGCKIRMYHVLYFFYVMSFNGV